MDECQRQRVRTDLCNIVNTEKFEDSELLIIINRSPGFYSFSLRCIISLDWSTVMSFGKKFDIFNNVLRLVCVRPDIL